MNAKTLTLSDCKEFNTQYSTVSETFKLIDSELRLKLTIVYTNYSGDTATYLSCGLRANLFKNSIADNPPLITLTATTESEANYLELVQISGNSDKGVHINFKGLEITSILFDESQRLYEFIKKMYGVDIRYTEDLFGFLHKNGKDIPVISKQPFPEIPTKQVAVR